MSRHVMEPDPDVDATLGECIALVAWLVILILAAVVYVAVRTSS